MASAIISARAKLVATERALDPVATDRAAAIISESGGDLIQAQELGSHIAG